MKYKKFGRVGDAHREVLGRAGAQRLEDDGGVPVGQALVAHDDVRGEHRQPGGHGPGVQVVHVLDVVDPQYMTTPAFITAKSFLMDMPNALRTSSGSFGGRGWWIPVE